MTYRNIWDYSQHRVVDAEDAHAFAMDLFSTTNPGTDWTLACTDDAFAQFEDELERRGQEMTKQPRNRRFPTKLPRGYTLLAATYGTGVDDYLAVVLGFHAEQKSFVVWYANFADGPQHNDTVACGNGAYFQLGDNPGNDDFVATQAWDNFCEKSQRFVVKAPHWPKGALKIQC